MADSEKTINAQDHTPAASEPEKTLQLNGVAGEKHDGDEHHDEIQTKEQKTNGANGNEKKEDGKGDDESKEDKQPAGGYDSTPLPKIEPGWTVKFTFLRATNLPMADINALSSDPFIVAELQTGLPQRHKEDPPLRFRTNTIRKDTNPVWNSEWIVANVPSSGFRLKARLYDEDPADHDDRLGNAHINVDRVSETSPNIKEQAYGIKKRMGSKRAYLVRAVATCIRVTKHMNGVLFFSAEVLGRTKDSNGGRAYTVGPVTWTKHYSPMLGRITGIKEENNEADDDDDGAANGNANGRASADKHKKRKTDRYNFQANQMQLPGPVPAELYHRYVEFSPFVKGMFTHKGLRGFLLNKALHHQHNRVYNYDRSTLWGIIPADDPEATTKRFLELVHYDRGGRIFTYVLTLDAQFRFTETGKEFGIDMLSKHTMHSDVAIYIAFSGEFFIKRRHHHQKANNDSQPAANGSAPDPSQPVVSERRDIKSNPTDQEGGQVPPTNPVEPETKEPETDLNPSAYELIIDNDSGTYRPNAKLLPLLRLFMQRSFPGLHVRVLDCQADEDKMTRLKDEQRERKKAAAGGATVVFAQRGRAPSMSSSESSSDEEDLDEVEDGNAERSFGGQVLRDAQWRAGAKVQKLKGLNPKAQRGGEAVVGDGEDGGEVAHAAGAAGGEGRERTGVEKVGGPTNAERNELPRTTGKDDARAVENQGQTIGSAARGVEGHVEGHEFGDEGEVAEQVQKRGEMAQ